MEGLKEKVDSLQRYRDSLDESEKELFDLLIGYAREIVVTIEHEPVSC